MKDLQRKLIQGRDCLFGPANYSIEKNPIFKIGVGTSEENPEVLVFAFILALITFLCKQYALMVSTFVTKVREYFCWVFLQKNFDVRNFDPIYFINQCCPELKFEKKNYLRSFFKKFKIANMPNLGQLMRDIFRAIDAQAEI